MAANVAITEAEYLRTSYPDTDREFRDGEVVERGMPDWFHSRAQLELGYFFRQREASHNISAAPELRLKIRNGLHLIPDVAVFWPAVQPGNAPDQLPLIVIEILSPDDKMSDVRGKLQEYAEWGVPHIWLVDPHRKIIYRFKDGLHEVKSVSADELSLTLQPSDIFE